LAPPWRRRSVPDAGSPHDPRGHGDRRTGRRRTGPTCHASTCGGGLSDLQARYETNGDVAEIVIDRPPLNLSGPELIAGIEDCVARAAAERPRALMVRAEGNVFSAGVDVHVFEGLDASSAAALTERLLRLTHALEDLPLPTLAVAQGLCLTAGLELALACDLLWAADGVQFGLVEKVVGITPLMGGTQRMAERAGRPRHPRGRRAHRRAHLTPVRDRRQPECGAIDLAGRSRQGHLHW
jgi:hypothetical protein